jgi:hypothetical protein
MLPTFDRAVRSSPHLQRVDLVTGATDVPDKGIEEIFAYLDELAGPKNAKSQIGSIQYGGEELLHVRLHHHHIEVADGLFEPGTRPSWNENTRSLKYTAKDGSERNLTLEWREEGAWHDYTDYDGLVVPLSILKKMQQAEGVNAEDWIGQRGIEVGDKAWRILTDWKEDRMARAATT